MRIIPDDVKPRFVDLNKPSRSNLFRQSDTIEITDKEWDDIVTGWIKYATSMPKKFKPFSQWLKDLIESKRSK